MFTGESTNVEAVPEEVQAEDVTTEGAAANVGEASVADTTTTVQKIPLSELEMVHDSGFETGRPSPAIPNEDFSSLQQHQPQQLPQPLQHHPQQQQQPEESRKQKVLKRLSFPLAWMESLGGKEEAPQVKGDGSSESLSINVVHVSKSCFSVLVRKLTWYTFFFRAKLQRRGSLRTARI